MGAGAAVGTPAVLVAVGQRLRVDGWTAEAVNALRSNGVRAILLKGPVVGRWLYPGEPLARTYTDVDLLVASSNVDRARRALRDLGYRGGVEPRRALAWDHATTLFRSTDGALVDLHWKLHGMLDPFPAAHAWEVVAHETAEMVVGGLPVEIPGVVARTLHVALHLNPGNAPGSQPWEDLRRAVERVDRPTWLAAAEMARGLHIAVEMGAILRLVPDGARLADDLGLPARPSIWFALNSAQALHGAPAGVSGVELLVTQAGLRAKAHTFRCLLFRPGADLRRVLRDLSRVPMWVWTWSRVRRAA